MTENIQFKKLEKEELPLLHKWLNEPHVKRWYDKDKDLTKIETVIEKYTPHIRGTIPTQAYIIIYKEKPVGYIQTYRINDHPDYGKHLDLKEDAAAIDIFIGDVDYVYKGLGAGIIRQFVKDYIFEKTDVVSCIIGPEPKNIAAIRAYEKAGFRYLKTVQIPNEPDPEYLMRLKRLEV